MVTGKLQREGEVIHVVVQECFNFSPLLQQLVPTPGEDLQVLTLCRADEKDGELHSNDGNRRISKKVVQGNLFPSRDFK